MRQWFLWVALIVLCVLVWWKYAYAPKLENRDDLNEKVSLETQKRNLLEKRLLKLQNLKQDDQSHQDNLARFVSRWNEKLKDESVLKACGLL